MHLCFYSENGIIKSDRVYEVMLVTDRAHYSRCNPYMDSPQSIGVCHFVVNVMTMFTVQSSLPCLCKLSTCIMIHVLTR